MTTLVELSRPETVADLIDRLGNVAPSRIRLCPPPGQATEADVLNTLVHGKMFCELVDGTLVEKAVGYQSSLLAGVLMEWLRTFVLPRNLGLVSGPDGFVRLSKGTVRGPDAAYISWDRIPGRVVPTNPIPGIVPELVIEVLSDGNTRAEMSLKRIDYFRAGVQVVWEIDPATRSAMEYRPDLEAQQFTATETLDGAEVLPGFLCPLSTLFAELDRRG